MKFLSFVATLIVSLVSIMTRGDVGKEMKSAAENVDAAAQFRYAEMLRTGNGVATNLAEAVVWTRKAAEGGHVEAQFRYAEILREGRGVAKNMKEAAKWTRKAAEGGHVEAQCQMGLFYMNGLGVDRDEDKAVEWLSRAAKKDHVQAQYNLGIYYAKFMDKESQRLAVKWLKEAAKEDYADAEYNLAKLYFNPHHPASKEQGAGRRAIQLLRLAAAQGHSGAKAKLEELGITAPQSPASVDELRQIESATIINNAF